MLSRYISLFILVALLLNGCGWNLNAPDGGNGTDPDTTTQFRNASDGSLPTNVQATTSQARAADIDDDGNLDLVLAVAFARNRILINSGDGTFADESNSRLPAQNYDSQDVTVADLNSDGNLDLFFVGNQNQTNELYINDGRGVYSDLSNRIPVSGNFTSVEALDIDGDGPVDILMGNIGQNTMLMNSGNAFFNNQSLQRLPQISDATHDITFADITGDNLRDIIVGNENGNRLLINTGSGFFADQTASRISFPNSIEETQDVNVADVDGDGDRDLYFGNGGSRMAPIPRIDY
ncbi:MAG: VCBS repeat-containing protein [Fodinibius sp.]|nr:VCBS repeat-containing protein [Fodinibius sp.]